jgi:outer membrane protein assembly factor BamD
MQKTMRLFRIAAMAASIAFGLTCSGRQQLSKSASPADAFANAKAVFDKKDYFKAKNLFTVIVLNHPAGETFEAAQYHLAESHFHLKEYVEAIAEYEKLIRSMPSSATVDDAQYKIGLCYFRLSPGYALDQDYTYKAIDQFQKFLEEYPDSDLKTEGEKRLAECREKLERKEFKTGELYTKMGHLKAAIISFDVVLDEYYDTPFADDALYLKALSHLKLGETETADLALRSLLVKYPDSPFRPKAENRLKSIARKG